MRYAAGELADKLHLLKLAQLVLGLPMRLSRCLVGGDIASDQIDQALLGGHRPVDPAI